MDKICDLWAVRPKIPLKVISAQLGLSRQTIIKHLRRARLMDPPDPRATRRLEYPSRHMTILLNVLEEAHPNGTHVDQIRDKFWPIGPLPANWRKVIMVTVSRAKFDYGANITNQDNIITLTGYVTDEK